MRIEIHTVSDLPPRLGLDLLPLLLLDFLNALYAYKGKMISPLKLAQGAIYVEQKLIKERSVIGTNARQPWEAELCEFRAGWHRQPQKTRDHVRQRKKEFKSNLTPVLYGVRFAEVLKEQIDKTRKARSRKISHIREMVDHGFSLTSMPILYSSASCFIKHGCQKKSVFISNPYLDEV
jgi:galactokinase/mevalonate kinase-like predicted kinase